MARTRDEVLGEMAPLRAELESIETAARIAKNTVLLGQCFKFRNSYGGDREKWWLYGLVTSIGEYWPSMFQFQVTCDNEIIIKQRGMFSGPNGEWESITRGEFDGEWVKVKELVMTLPMPE